MWFTVLWMIGYISFPFVDEMVAAFLFVLSNGDGKWVFNYQIVFWLLPKLLAWLGGLPSAYAYADASRPALIGVTHEAISDSCEEMEVNVRAKAYSGALDPFNLTTGQYGERDIKRCICL